MLLLYRYYKKKDGENKDTWIFLGEQKNMNFGNKFYVGIAVTSHDRDKLATLRCNNYSVSKLVDPVGFDIGNIPVSGSSTRYPPFDQSGKIEIKGSGCELYIYALLYLTQDMLPSYYALLHY